MNSSPCQQFRFKAAHGFTLIELVVAVAVAGLLFSFAAPSFQRLIQNNQRDSAVYALIGDLQFARSESIKRSSRLGVCARKESSDTECDNTNTANWRNGWLVFVDNGDDSGSYEPAKEDLLRVGNAIHPTLDVTTRARLTSSANTEGAVNFVRFGPRGTSNWRGGGYLLFCDEGDDSTDSANAVNVSLSGDIRRARRDGDGNLVSAFGTAPVCPKA